MKRRFADMMPSHETVSNAYLTFLVNDRTYAVKVPYVLEIAEITSITALPRTAPDILGVTMVHDTVYSVMDLRRKLGSENPTTLCPVVAILLMCKDTKMCVVVDKVSAVVDVDDTGTSAPLGDNPCVTGVVQVKGISVSLLSVERIFDDNSYINRSN